MSVIQTRIEINAENSQDFIRLFSYLSVISNLTLIFRYKYFIIFHGYLIVYKKRTKSYFF